MSDTEDHTMDETPRKPSKGIYVLPNLFTLAALFGGFYAIVMAMHGRFEQSVYGVFCAMVLDSLDGRVARMTNTQSAFGEQMDSLADMVSFGVAPALLAYQWMLQDMGKLGFFVAFLYASGAALRLARFRARTVAGENFTTLGEGPERVLREVSLDIGVGLQVAFLHRQLDRLVQRSEVAVHAHHDLGVDRDVL